jgi:hypothetical protein
MKQKATVKLSDGSVIDATVSDVDLDKEVLSRSDGTSWTEAESWAESEAVRRATPGKPSLSGRGTSPQIGVRLPAELRKRLSARAARDGRRESDLVREAIERYLAS